MYNTQSFIYLINNFTLGNNGDGLFFSSSIFPSLQTGFPPARE
ncbi:hypothetical protein ASZ90_007134 [hydrocarbon metagenome]|uniref:Uncharacterized protein n=1 Tax=hydrocarbon metagenome TaxID=938273 RepID=A0A0W8FQK6_9ZZZZ